jgi:hypothetical protein
MANQKSDLVEDFVLSTLPKNYLGALRMLAELTFPISDRKTFMEKVDQESSESNESVKTMAESLKESLDVLDFPIESVQNAMEKFHTKHLWGFDPHSIHTLGGGLEGFLRRRRVEYIQQFGIECGLDGFDVMQDRVSRGAHPARADIAGMETAMNCLATRGDRLPPWWAPDVRPTGGGL